jgi:hypothetical protein
MIRSTVVWLVALTLVAPAWLRAQGVPGPRLPQPKAADDKDAPPGNNKEPKKPADDPAGKDRAAEPPPVLFPPEPFPPPAPAVLDPRTRAWEQVHGGAYVTNLPPIAPTPDRPADLLPPLEKDKDEDKKDMDKKDDKKDNGKKDDKADKGPQVRAPRPFGGVKGVTVVGSSTLRLGEHRGSFAASAPVTQAAQRPAVLPQGSPRAGVAGVESSTPRFGAPLRGFTHPAPAAPTPAPIGARPQVSAQASSPYSLVGHTSAAPRERVLRITRNPQTGAWEIVDVTRQP